jgi:hypothetical protein
MDRSQARLNPTWRGNSVTKVFLLSEATLFTAGRSGLNVWKILKDKSSDVEVDSLGGRLCSSDVCGGLLEFSLNLGASSMNLRRMG